MKDQNKTKQQLIEELSKLRKQNAGLGRLSNEQKIEEERYRSLVESTEDSVYVVDKDIRYTYMNKQNLSRLGLPINKIIGKTYGEFHTKEGTAKFKKRINKRVLSAKNSNGPGARP